MYYEIKNYYRSYGQCGRYKYRSTGNLPVLCRTNLVLPTYPSAHAPSPPFTEMSHRHNERCFFLFFHPVFKNQLIHDFVDRFITRQPHCALSYGIRRIRYNSIIIITFFFLRENFSKNVIPTIEFLDNLIQYTSIRYF